MHQSEETPDNIAAFLGAMQHYVPEHARIMACQFRGDPYADQRGKWRARVIRDASQIDPHANVFFCVSAMQKNKKGEFRRRKENFAGGLVLMIDDVGSGPGSKFGLDAIQPLQPTAMVETSPQNYQAIYFFDRLIEDANYFDALIKSFINKQFLNDDPGMAGINRVFRPPAGTNGKKRYGGWTVRMTKWHPELRYAPETLVQAFDLEVTPKVHRPKDNSMILGAKADRIRAFVTVRAALRSAGMLKREEEDQAGWIDIVCPWTEEHSGIADSGAAIRIPDAENDWFGGFRCHHGHCADRRWRDLTQWLADDAEENLDHVNAHWAKIDSTLKIQSKDR